MRWLVLLFVLGASVHTLFRVLVPMLDVPSFRVLPWAGAVVMLAVGCVALAVKLREYAIGKLFFLGSVVNAAAVSVGAFSHDPLDGYLIARYMSAVVFWGAIAWVTRNPTQKPSET